MGSSIRRAPAPRAPGFAPWGLRLALAGALSCSGAATVGAESSSAAPAGVEIVTLGTAGGPTWRKDRAQPANLLIVGGRPYLIDCGDGVVRDLTLAGVQPKEIRTVFLTHLHFDHTEGLAAFMAFDWISRPDGPTAIYGPPGTTVLTRAGLAYDGVAEAIFTPQIPSPRPMASLFFPHDLALDGQTVVFQDDRVRVTATPNTHYVTLPKTPRSYGIDRSYSYRFDTPGRSVVFTGDTGPSDAVAALARGADVLVSEVIDSSGVVRAIRDTGGRDGDTGPLIAHMTREHLSPEAVGQLAAKAGVKMVVLTHLVTAAQGDAARYIAGVKRYYSGPVRVAQDLEKF